MRMAFMALSLAFLVAPMMQWAPGSNEIGAAETEMSMDSESIVVDQMIDESTEERKLIRVLFGDGKIPRGCSFTKRTPNKPRTASNLELRCPAALYYCDAITADCGEH